MKFEVDKREKVVVVTAKVEKLDALCAPELKGELVLANKEGHRNMVLDLSETRYIDSSGLSAILIGHRGCRDAQGSFVLAACSLQWRSWSASASSTASSKLFPPPKKPWILFIWRKWNATLNPTFDHESLLARSPAASCHG